MRMFHVCVACLALLAVLANAPALQAQSGARARALPHWCSEPEMASWPMAGLKGVLDRGGADVEQMYALPRMPSDSIVRVTDERVCERAARAYYRSRLGPMPAGGVAVLRVGNRYAVYGNNRAGEWTILQIFSDRFELITSIAE